VPLEDGGVIWAVLRAVVAEAGGMQVIHLCDHSQTDRERRTGRRSEGDPGSAFGGVAGMYVAQNFRRGQRPMINELEQKKAFE